MQAVMRVDPGTRESLVEMEVFVGISEMHVELFQLGVLSFHVEEGEDVSQLRSPA